ncbi:hypothetical protein [Vibrio anguillarum]|uniref:hypothetical protein n=1 Tax=Vibrio anguillarum TaxID=55601 RepID=UPI00040F2DE1|nr:hypothetical protein [Vibrio anguillarum]
MEQRLAFLMHANVISQRAYDGFLTVIAMMDRQLGLPHDNEQYQMSPVSFIACCGSNLAK